MGFFYIQRIGVVSYSRNRATLLSQKFGLSYIKIGFRKKPAKVLDETSTIPYMVKSNNQEGERVFWMWNIID